MSAAGSRPYMRCRAVNFIVVLFIDVGGNSHCRQSMGELVLCRGFYKVVFFHEWNVDGGVFGWKILVYDDGNCLW